MQIQEIAIGLGMMFLTTMIHSIFMVGGIRLAEWRISRYGGTSGHFGKAFLVSSHIAWMFLAIVIEAWLWALLYLYHPLITTIPDLETAFYFSMVTYTTLGYGDVVLTGSWRTLASIQAANGVIIFGWTTALIFIFIQRVYSRDKPVS
jgi:hypothetical protein